MHEDAGQPETIYNNELVVPEKTPQKEDTNTIDAPEEIDKEKQATGAEVSTLPQDGKAKPGAENTIECDPVHDALHQAVRRRRASTKGKGKAVQDDGPKEATNGKEPATAPTDDDDLRASDAARKRRRLSTTPTPNDRPRDLHEAEDRVQHAPRTLQTDNDGDTAMGDERPAVSAAVAEQIAQPSPSAASSDFLWGSLGEIDPEVLALLNTTEGALLGIHQGDEIAPSIYEPPQQSGVGIPGPSKALQNDGNSPPRWLANSSGKATQEAPRKPEEDDIFRPEPIIYEEPDLFTRVMSNMKRAPPPAPANTQYIRRGPPQLEEGRIQERAPRPRTTGIDRSSTPRPPTTLAAPSLAPATKLPSFRRHPPASAQHHPVMTDQTGEATPRNRETAGVLDEDLNDPLLHLDDLIEEFDPTPAPLESLYKVTLPADARKRVSNTNPYWKVKDMGEEQKRLWNQNEGPAILIHFPGCGTRDPSIGEKINLTRLDLADRFSVDGGRLRFLIAHAKNQHNHPNKEPFFIIVFGLTQEQCDELTEKVWHSSKRITFGAEPREPKPSWLVAIYVHYERFLDPSEKGMARVFMRIFLQKDSQRFIMNIINRDIQRGGRWYGRTASVKEAFSTFIKSVETHLVRRQITGGIDEPLVAVYVEPPTDDPEDWIAFRNFVQTQRVGSELTGFPELYKQWVYCQLCHSRDHFVGLCPVPGYPGWKGPKSSDITEKRAPDRDQDRDRARSQAPRGNAPNPGYGPPVTQQRPAGRPYPGNRGNDRRSEADYIYYEY